ncbi:hypothetical protein [Pseudarthrobacter albicanus]|uniref:hypothetical protein n=1 Tax=Pseudarthrobacter albicanus TaxID=2823873 RepID=UPI001BACF2B7|nr:hypothetical protein [Pseudarthrobacter albicanus]
MGAVDERRGGYRSRVRVIRRPAPALAAGTLGQPWGIEQDFPAARVDSGKSWAKRYRRWLRATGTAIVAIVMAAA